MNRFEKELAQLGLEKEKEVRAAIESTYSNALEEIGERIKSLMADEMTQSKVYRIEFQKALRGMYQRCWTVCATVSMTAFRSISKVVMRTVLSVRFIRLTSLKYR